MVNLSLDGIMKDDVTTENHQKFWRSFVFEEFFSEGLSLKEQQLTLPISNPFDFGIKGQLEWVSSPASRWKVLPEEMELFTLSTGQENLKLQDSRENRQKEKSNWAFA